MINNFIPRTDWNRFMNKEFDENKIKIKNIFNFLIVDVR